MTIRASRTGRQRRAAACAVAAAALGALLGTLAARAAWGETVALRAARMIDVRSGSVVRDAVVVVEGERIRAAGSRATVAVPPGARVIELGDRTLLPGPMDMHVHLSAGSTRPRRFADFMFDSPVDNAFRAADNVRATLAAGFTSVRSAGDNDFIDVALDKAIGATASPTRGS